jgi:tRNA (cmo5U34)-methyltransferase
MDALVDRLKIPADWTFKSENVAHNFDSHVRSQLPWYDLATGIVAHVARQYLPMGGTAVDIGASTGNIGRALAETIKARSIDFQPIDNAEQMKAVYDGPGELEIIKVQDYDFESVRPDLVVAFLALMFVPMSERRGLIEEIKKHIARGGAFVIFDKMEPRGGYLGTVAYRLTLAADVAGVVPPSVYAGRVWGDGHLPSREGLPDEQGSPRKAERGGYPTPQQDGAAALQGREKG